MDDDAVQIRQAHACMHVQVDALLDQGSSLYSPAVGMKDAIQHLIQGNPTPEPGPATLSMGQGTWEVYLCG